MEAWRPIQSLVRSGDACRWGQGSCGSPAAAPLARLQGLDELEHRIVISSNRVIGAITLSDLPIPAAFTIIAGLIAMSWWATILVGGGTVVAPLWYFVPIFLAGLRFEISRSSPRLESLPTPLTGPFLPCRDRNAHPPGDEFLAQPRDLLHHHRTGSPTPAWLHGFAGSQLARLAMAFEVELGAARAPADEAARDKRRWPMRPRTSSSHG